MKIRPVPPAHPHGTLVEVFPDVYFVTGTMRFPGPVPMMASRNMVVVRTDGGLVLVNSVRLDDAGLSALDALGKLAHVVRLAGFHGSDDAFYKERYAATVWAVAGQFYSEGFDTVRKPAKVYFQADRELVVDGPLPMAGRLYPFPSTPAEALLVLDQDGGIVIAGDSLQNWTGPDAYFNWFGRTTMRMMGFFRPCNVGPGWLKQAKPSAQSLRGILDLPFAHVLPAHGEPVIGGAKERFRPAIEAAAASLG